MGLLGMGNGAVFQLVPQRFAERIGIVTGIVGAAGGLGGFFLPSLLGIAKDATGSYGAGLLVDRPRVPGWLRRAAAARPQWSVRWQDDAVQAIGHLLLS